MSTTETQYTALTDAPFFTAPTENEAVVEVWYWRDGLSLIGYEGGPSVERLEQSHIKLGEFGCRRHLAERRPPRRVEQGYEAPEILAELSQTLQGEVWSPRGEAVSLIRGLGLTHTSLSTGDVAVVTRPGADPEVWMADRYGWRFLGLRPEEEEVGSNPEHLIVDRFTVLGPTAAKLDRLRHAEELLGQALSEVGWAFYSSEGGEVESSAVSRARTLLREAVEREERNRKLATG